MRNMGKLFWRNIDQVSTPRCSEVILTSRVQISRTKRAAEFFGSFIKPKCCHAKDFFRQLLCNCMIKCILMKLKIKSDAVKNQVNILRIFFSFIINSLSMFQWQLITYLSTEPARRLLDNFHENSFKTQTEFLLKWTDR